MVTGTQASFLQAFYILSEAKDEHTRKRQILLRLYKDADECLEDMNNNIFSLLETKVGNVNPFPFE